MRIVQENGLYQGLYQGEAVNYLMYWEEVYPKGFYILCTEKKAVIKDFTYYALRVGITWGILHIMHWELESP